jgi:mono/diheme cytochrome c family protein
MLGIAILVAGLAAPLFVFAQATPEPDAPDEAALIERGEEIYAGVCIACHQAEGAGIEGIYPALAGNPLVTLEDPKVVVETVLYGRGGMPRFGDIYSDEDIAAVVSYIRNAWGNQAPPVMPDQAAEIRAAFEASPEATPQSPSTGQEPDEAGATPETE